MQPFVVNQHGRLVFPSNFLPDLDFSVIESEASWTAVIRRDFETKAPNGHRDPGAGRDRRVRQPVRTDARRRAQPVLGQPVRDDDVRQAARCAGGTSRGRGMTSSCRSWRPGRTGKPRSARWTRPTATWPRPGTPRRGPDLGRAVRRVRQPDLDATSCPRSSRPSPRRCWTRRSSRSCSRTTTRTIRHPHLRGDRRLQRRRSRARGAAPLVDGAAQPVPVGPLEGAAQVGRQPGRRRRRRAVPPADAATCCGSSASSRSRPGVPAAGRRPDGGPRRVQPIRRYPPTDVRKQFTVMPKIESLAVVKGEIVCSNEDLIRNAAYSWSPMTRR